MDIEDKIWKTCPETVATPFRYFADPRAYKSSLDPFPFPRLFDLPPEVLGCVFESCDASTLFQLMRSCKFLRSMTSKLFWSNSTVCYQISSGWWISQKTNQLRSSRLDVEFARYITQIEIDCGRLEWEFTHPQDGEGSWSSTPLAEKATFFWDAVRRSFPSVRHIILITCSLRNPSPPSNGEYDAEYTPISVVLSKVPRDIDVIVSCRGTLPQTEPKLWKFDMLKTPQLQPAQKPWPRKLVVPPSKQFCNGTLRDYESMCKTIRFLQSEMRGLQFLRRETHILYRKGTGIKCPNKACKDAFIGRSAWEHHFWSSPGRDCNTFADDYCAVHTPLHVREALDAKSARISELRSDYKKMWMKLRLAMGDPDTLGREKFANTVEKLAEELYPSTNQDNNWHLHEYMCGGFWAHFDPTHVYYSPAISGYDSKSKASDVDACDGDPPQECSDDSDCDKESQHSDNSGYVGESQQDFPDGSDRGGRIIDVELEKHRKQSYDAF